LISKDQLKEKEILFLDLVHDSDIILDLKDNIEYTLKEYFDYKYLISTFCAANNIKEFKDEFGYVVDNFFSHNLINTY
jgi:hypothetical protein